MNAFAIALYIETMSVVMLDEPLTADYVSQVEVVFNRAVDQMDASAQTEFRALWFQLNLGQYVGEMGRASWTMINRGAVPTAIDWQQGEVKTYQSMVMVISLLSLLSLTLFIIKKRRA